MTESLRTYILIAKGKESAGGFKDADDRSEFMRRFHEWERELTQKGLFIRSDQLPKKFKRVRERNGDLSVVDGPFAETKELLTGFFLIRAQEINQAVEMAKTCPVTRFDDLEVYELEGSV